jgi:prevent-host-death family protein
VYIYVIFNVHMEVTITKLRQNLFQLVDRALAGEPLQFTYKGTVFKIVPEPKPSKLAKLTRHEIVAPPATLERAGEDLRKEMEAEWEQDWAEL